MPSFFCPKLARECVLIAKFLVARDPVEIARPGISADLPRSSEDALTTCRRCTIGLVAWHWRASLSWLPRPPTRGTV